MLDFFGHRIVSSDMRITSCREAASTITKNKRKYTCALVFDVRFSRRSNLVFFVGVRLSIHPEKIKDGSTPIEIKLQKLGIGQAQNLNCEARLSAPPVYSYLVGTFTLHGKTAGRAARFVFAAEEE